MVRLTPQREHSLERMYFHKPVGYSPATSAVKSPVQLPSDEALAESLRKRQEELQKPRRYVVRTQRGFLNVHADPDDPYRSDNVVGRLWEGEIVTGLEDRGDWLRHDHGGWSIRFHGGFEWLRPLDE
ncbi:Canalicular multispecific organic anion transporter 1 [Durusdinium trenchii]|uniref:Canalicular multispecific organic anion transporter 1 n=1 Tax=Durusdinium trenchii TaxID=1381693 RepID=A0ABP0RDU7_9DINO